MPQSPRKPWVTYEIEAIVADYMDMLRVELAGGKVVKAKHNQALQKLIGRSHRAIEYKHCNISAVLASLGLPFIQGYKPLTHYQLALFKITEDHLAKHGLYEALAGADTASIISHKKLIYEPPPITDKKLNTDHLAVCQIISKFDQTEHNAGMSDLGQAGEAFLLQAEKNRLSACGRHDLASKVRWVSKEDGDGLGYDVFSFSENGTERWLEVKTTNGPLTMPFYLSANERRVSEEHRDKFRLVRLYNFSWRPAAYKLKPPLTDHVRLMPTQYRAELLDTLTKTRNNL